MKQLIEERDAKTLELNGLVTEMDDMEKGEDLDGKIVRSNELLEEIKVLDGQIKSQEEVRKNLKEVEESRKSLDIKEEDISETRAEIKEPDLYREGGEHNFIKDAYSSRKGDYKASERINSHQEHEARDVGTGAFTGLVVPQYLLDMYAPIARAGSAFYNAASKEQLPQFGNQIEVSRITTGSTTAPQATENAAVSETDIDDTLLTVPVNTIAGQQDVSRQALERGGGSGFSLENVIFQDLLSAYYTTLDQQMWTGTGANGQHTGMIQVAGIGAITYTDA